jgi:hypothetical protein
MTLQIGEAVRDGLSLAASRNGAVLAALFFASETLGLLLLLGAGTMYVPVDVGTGLASGSELPAGELPAAASAVAMLLTGVFNSIVFVPISIIAIRTFVGGETERFPDAYLFRRIGRATLSGVLASFAQAAILFGAFFGAALLSVGVLIALSGPAGIAVAILIGCLALVVFAVAWLHFLFFLHEIAVRDRGVVDAFRGSWDTVRGNRLELVILGGGVTITRMVVSQVGAPSPEFQLTVGRLVGSSVWLVVSAVLGVAGVAIVASAYRQLRPDVDRSDPGGATTATYETSRSSV